MVVEIVGVRTCGGKVKRKNKFPLHTHVLTLTRTHHQFSLLNTLGNACLVLSFGVSKVLSGENGDEGYSEPLTPNKREKKGKFNEIR